MVQLKASDMSHPGTEIETPAKMPKYACLYRPAQEHPQRIHAHTGKQLIKITCQKKVMLLIRQGLTDVSSCL
jgi:hypothetical protein